MNRRELLAALASAATLPLLPGCARGRVTPPTSPAPRGGAALAVLNDVGENLLRLFPESATQLGIDTGARAELRSRLTDRSAEGRRRIAAQVRADLDRVDAIDTAGLSHATRTSVEVVRSAYATALEGLALPYGDTTVGSWRNTPYTVIQNVGAYLDIPRSLDADHPIENAADAEAYLARLESYAKQLDGETGRMQAARGLGLVPPAFLLDKALGQIRLSARSAREGGSLVESIERRTKTIPGDWARRARTIAMQAVAPALDRQIAELEAERAVATGDAGIWARPRGEEFYRWALHASTTTTRSPDDIHETGKRELEQLHARMDEILKGLGYTNGTVGERMKALAADPRYQFPEGDAGRAEILAFVQQRLDWVRAQMPRMFHTLVHPNMEVKRLPPEEEPGAPAAYGGAGSIDGKIPGRFWINLRTTSLHSRYSLGDLAFHEAIPGHIWQGEYTHEMPLVRQLLAFNAYSEGWALYAEQLADEFGAYENDPVGRLGYLQSLAFRACRLVVDTGIHAKRWTREQGVQFFVDVNGSNPLEVASEVDRYCSWPGQACGYKVGHSEIVRQRQKAMTALGPTFDVRAFNDTVVLGGNVPLDVLAKNVGEYVHSATK
ncbi:protein of unknown function DUF885 (plasmid) [Gemmatirosa kalamazoonensis]|uniref:DUF885 domain-containing protein n=1 Tax=Gemmatirosa kalamazoonensis TaxID=861299 RepID=W0RR34_9BACT|nr:DUF885 domain-containing protein [Gemmatirosa kalamazoonensis]AHG92927.1 protein of unknown function DUF885 [Gemmatirosa kalamazoonensis]